MQTLFSQIELHVLAMTGIGLVLAVIALLGAMRGAGPRRRRPRDHD